MANAPPNAGQRKPPPALEAFFTTDLTLSAHDILNEYRDRWAVEIEIRDADAFDGLGQDQCRKRQRILGANTFRLVMAAARTLWFIAQVERGTDVPLCRYRPWYRQKVAPSQLDVVWACREALHEAGIFPIPRFTPDLAENHEEPAYARTKLMTKRMDQQRPSSVSHHHDPGWVSRRSITCLRRCTLLLENSV